MFACATLLGAVGTWGVRAFALRYEILSYPNPIVPQHTRSVAYLGGLGILVGAGFTVILFGILSQWGFLSLPEEFEVSWSIVVPSLLFLVLGVADDLMRFSNATKASFLTVAAIFAVVLGLGYPLTNIWLLDSVISCLWILTLVNAFNFTDVCDGLVAGLAVILFLFLGGFRFVDPLFALTVAGACVGFLFFNLPPATIFLGDAGSNLLGFLAAAFTLTGMESLEPWPHLSKMVLAVSVPLFELLFLAGVRIKKGLLPWKASSDHFSLRLQGAGLSGLQTDVIAWSAAVFLCGTALALDMVSPFVQIVILLAVFIAFALSWRLLLRWEVASYDTHVR